MTTSQGRGLGRRRLLLGGAALVAAAGLPRAPAIAQSPALRIGALVPLSGGLDAHAAQAQLGIDVAIEMINGAGGVLGRRVEAVYRDSKGTPAGLDTVCASLIDDEGVSAVVGPFIAAGRKAAARALAGRGVPLVSASNNEGTFCHPSYFSVGPTPNQDIFPLIRHLDGGLGGRTYFLVGSYSSWQHSSFRQAILKIIYGLGGTVHGQALTNIGEQRFAPVIRWIQETGAEIVIFCVPRPEGAAFVREARAMGLLDAVRLGWVGFNEMHLARLEPEASRRVTTVSPFVAGDADGGVPDLVARFAAGAGGAVPVTYYAYTHFLAASAIAEACRRSGATDPAAAAAGLAGLEFASATGPVAIDAATHHASLSLVVARGDGDRLSIVERLGRVDAEPGCTAA